MAHNIEGEETMVREQFQWDLKTLQQKVIELGELAREAITCDGRFAYKRCRESVRGYRR
ncbi:hypothetical protein bcgnr5390_19630 [Bacillus luti]